MNTDIDIKLEMHCQSQAQKHESFGTVTIGLIIRCVYGTRSLFLGVNLK